jgi:hypothetical protein
MPRKSKSIFYIYKITCNVTGRYYIGMHSTSNLEDGYFGSGKRLKYSIQKHGLENHVKEILEFLENKESLINKEIQLVNTALLNDPMCMNLKPGGSGGFCNEIHKKNYIMAGSVAGLKRIRELKDDPIWHDKISNERKNRWKNEEYRAFMKSVSEHAFKGKSHSVASKLKIGTKISTYQSGSGNSQYGMIWITNDINNKKIKKHEPLPIGWRFGRKILK